MLSSSVNVSPPLLHGIPDRGLEFRTRPPEGHRRSRVRKEDAASERWSRRGTFQSGVLGASWEKEQGRLVEGDLEAARYPRNKESLELSVGFVAGHTGEDESIAGVPEDTRRGQDASSLEIPAGGTQRSGIVVGGQSSRNVVG